VFESRGGIITFYLFLFTSFSKSFSLYYLPLIHSTSTSVIIYICWPYESSISMRSRGCHTLMHDTGRGTFCKNAAGTFPKYPK